ncbi:MAG: threonylcarbamoyl-AMP synthase [Bacteroidales bacterium]|nr:threonylcarbamoyl-AMP synthase [Bacteroidales bacterium]MBR1894436.1 threonylcarbamoyl-AMP synthase [Bacteroidales bacterium]
MARKNQTEIIAEALAVLRDGGLILYPTDTVWGIGCDATNPAAVAKVFALKKRPDSKSLVLLASDLDMVARYIKVIPPIAVDLVEVNDRPMTLVYPGAICGRKPAEGEEARAERHLLAWNTVAEDGSVGIRIPMMDFCRDLVARLARPLVSTSANLSGEPSPHVFAEISQEIRDGVDYVVEPSLEKGSTGLASQIIKVEVDGQVTIIRP